MESVQLDMEIGGSVLSVSVSDVLYASDWNEACLISWRRIDMQGRFRIVSEDDIITVQRRCDQSPFCIAELMYGSY